MTALVPFSTATPAYVNYCECGDWTLALAHAALKSEKLPAPRVIDSCSMFRPERNFPLAETASLLGVALQVQHPRHAGGSQQSVLCLPPPPRRLRPHRSLRLL